ncbi:kelch 40 [Paramuricea clavata]|uniref:Kelch 40 n=1 Tax=Paramuricea clavata TaxID=317549 RepID=A0A7D9L8Q4_PARCT|nr:kelch 40 [Paramuricea clavata]
MAYCLTVSTGLDTHVGTEVCEHRGVEVQDCGQTQDVEKLEGRSADLVLSPSTQEILNTHREDILVASGACDRAEIYSWQENAWYEVSEMNESHVGASSFVYNDRLYVVGGVFTETIEMLDLNELPLKWTEYPDGFPYEIGGNPTVVYQQRVITVGGFIDDEDKNCNAISELQLASPCTMKQLCPMPQPRIWHAVEAFDDKVLILGGANGDHNYDVLDGVLEFDPEKNECKELPSLPYPVEEMATVRWRDQVVVLGGCDKDDEALNDVFMYDSKTGENTVLPSMLEKRRGCCAVVTRNTIVVMGGVNDAHGYLDSVEYFTMGGSTWKYLPSMKKERWQAVAIVLPSTRKYVQV